MCLILEDDMWGVNPAAWKQNMCIELAKRNDFERYVFDFAEL